MFPVTFLHPEHLWWLLLLPVLFLLAMPPQPHTVLWTAHLPQWVAAQKLLRRRPPRLRGLRFLLLALACIAAAAALAEPRLPGEPGPTRLVVLLDGSASMAANTAHGTAFAVAREALQRGLAVVPPSVVVTLLRCGGPLLRRHGPSARALHDLGEPEGSGSADLVTLAASLQKADTAVWTLTDGQGTAAGSDGPHVPTVGALSVCGTAVANAAILAVRTTDRWPLPQFDVEVDLVAFGGAPQMAHLHVTGAIDAPVDLPVELRPGVVATVAAVLTRTAAGGPLELRVELTGDALPGDDRWRAELPRLPAPRLAVLTEAEGGPFAAVAAEALAAEVSGEVVPAVAGVDVGLLLVDGGEVAIAPGTVRAIGFGSRFAGSAEPTPWLQPTLADWDRTGPLTAGLDLSELQIRCAFRATLPPGVPFLWAAEPGGDRVPLAVVCGGPDTASVHFAFRLQDSNLPLLPAFPQLLRRAFVRCYGGGAQLRVATAAPAAGEQDLWRRATATDRPLPSFGTPERELASLLLFGGLCAMVLRAFVR